MAPRPVKAKSKHTGSSVTILMTEGSIFKEILLFSIPLILGNLLQQMYNTADSIIVGNFIGSNALAAVGSGSSIINLLIAFSQGAAAGAGVVVSQYLGAGNKKGVQSAVHTAISISVILGIIMTAAGVLSSRAMLELMNTPSQVIGDSAKYLQIYFGGIIFNVIYNMATGIMNAAGNSKRPLVYLGISASINVVLDLLLIRVFEMGVAGAAIATDISQAISCILAVVFLMRVNADYKIHIKKLHLNGAMAAKIIKIGLPAGIQNMVISLSNVLVQSSVNGFGTAAMAGYGSYIKIDGFNILPVLSFSMAVTTFTGQNYGAGKTDRVKKGMWITLAMGIVYTIITGVLILTFSRQIMRLFSSDPQVIEYGALAMKYFCPFYFLLSILNSLAGTVRGAGKPIPPMIILVVSMCLFRIAWVKLAVPYFETIDGVFLLYPISWAIGVILMVIYTRRGKWLDIKKNT